MSTFVVGLTGGLASGKSTVLNFFRQLGADTYSADQIVHDLLMNDDSTYSIIVKHFGNNILNVENKINKHKLRSIIFNDSEEKKWLENYLHPLVRAAFIKLCKKSLAPYVVIEIPLLTESKTAYEWLDRILVIDTDENTQLMRAQLRSGLSMTESQHILNQQAPREKRNKIADDLIINNGDLSTLELQVKRLHENYLGSMKFRVG